MGRSWGSHLPLSSAVTSHWCSGIVYHEDWCPVWPWKGEGPPQSAATRLKSLVFVAMC